MAGSERIKQGCADFAASGLADDIQHLMTLDCDELIAGHDINRTNSI